MFQLARRRIPSVYVTENADHETCQAKGNTSCLQHILIKKNNRLQDQGKVCHQVRRAVILICHRRQEVVLALSEMTSDLSSLEMKRR